MQLPLSPPGRLFRASNLTTGRRASGRYPLALACALAGLLLALLIGPLPGQAGAGWSYGLAAAGLLLDAALGRRLEQATPPRLGDEDAHWRRHHTQQAFASEGDYASFATAYQVGHLGRLVYPHLDFAAAEPRLEAEYRRRHGSLPWPLARQAAQAAWEQAWHPGKTGAAPPD